MRQGLARTGALADGRIAPLRAYLTGGLTIFIFHDITGDPSDFQVASQTFTGPDEFREQAAWIRHRFTVIEPRQLRQLGGHGTLPPNAALITFDDAWAGSFRLGTAILGEQGLSALCFVNMGTVAGDPDLAAVRRYEHRTASTTRPILNGPIARKDRSTVLAQIRDTYRDEPSFLSYQGATATLDDLAQAAGHGNVWFGSHLYHHWDLRVTADDLYEDSYVENEAALAAFPNRLSAFATPHGYASHHAVGPRSVPARCGARLIFTGTGDQNRVAGGTVLDRITFPTGRVPADEWWFVTHHRRAFGKRFARLVER
jgi:hypothetical protein